MAVTATRDPWSGILDMRDHRIAAALTELSGACAEHDATRVLAIASELRAIADDLSMLVADVDR